MRTKLLIAGFAGLSLLAAAQSQSTENKDTVKTATAVKSPRDLATGQASGKVGAQGVIHRDLAAREAATGKATGKVADVDGDGSSDRTAGTGYNVKSQTKARVAAGDVNGDGVADGTSSGSAKPAATSGHTDVKSPRDLSTGMPTGKRQHQPMMLKETEGQPNK